MSFRTQDWIPLHLTATRNASRSHDFRAFFYLGFQAAGSGANSEAAVKLINANEDPEKFYKVTVSSSGRVAIFENVRTRGFLLGRTRHEERVKATNTVDLGDSVGREMIGFWTL